MSAEERTPPPSPRDHDLARTPPPAAAWPPRRTPPALDEATVHVWSASAVPSAAGHERLLAQLAEEEQARRARFRFRGDRLRFAVGRGLLRTLAACYTGLPPAALVLIDGAGRKPAFALPAGAPPLRFNLSHSGALVLCAFARGHEVGVDVEALREAARGSEIVRRYFAPEEQRALAAAGPGDRDRAFLRVWTRKEAVLKATGRGLALPLERVVVPASADEGSFEVVVGAESAEWPGASRWSVRPLSPAPGYEGALAHEPGPRRVELFHYPDV